MLLPNGRRRSRDLPALSEINVTPFVDVALVLLIIFIITAHAIDSGIDVDVPKTKTVATRMKDTPPIVTIKKSGDLFLGQQAININRLVDEIHRRYPEQTAVYIKSDRLATMEIGVNVMSVLGAAKFSVSVVTELDNSTGH
jgi:biopolymer transport protein ExbD